MKQPTTLTAVHQPRLPAHLGEVRARPVPEHRARDEIDDAAGLAALAVVAAAADRLEAARAALARDGEFITTGGGALRPHPALHVEKTAGERLLAGLRALRLDLSPKLPRGPPGIPTRLAGDGGPNGNERFLSGHRPSTSPRQLTPTPRETGSSCTGRFP